MGLLRFVGRAIRATLKFVVGLVLVVLAGIMALVGVIFLTVISSVAWLFSQLIPARHRPATPAPVVAAKHRLLRKLRA